MELFGFGKKKEFDMERSDSNKKIMRELFNGVVEDGDSYQLVYGYSQNITTNNYLIARKTTHEFTSLIVGFRQSDMSIAIVQTTPELDGCSELQFLKKSEIKKAKIQMGMYVVYKQDGFTAGYLSWGSSLENDERYLVYVYQPEEYEMFNEFFKKFSAK